MQMEQHISGVPRIVVAAEPARTGKSASRRQVWFAAMTTCFVAGLVLGISGLTFSLLTAAGAVTHSRSLSLTVTSMIAGSLGLLLFGAHAMDRMDEGSRKNSDDETDLI